MWTKMDPVWILKPPPQQAEVAKSSMKVAKSSRSGIEIYNGEVALLQIGVMITSLEVALSQKYLHIFLYKSIMWSSNK